MKQKHHNQFVRCVENIQDLSGQGLFEYALMLGGGLCHTRYRIKYNSKTKKYVVMEGGFLASNSKKAYTKEQLAKETNFIKGMEKRCLIALIK